MIDRRTGCFEARAETGGPALARALGALKVPIPNVFDRSIERSKKIGGGKA